ncbi:MAG: hypothetical protein K2K10_00025 [Acetatifactor sp.]|nr:hypothetical protein [Acetatifactor sp.]
MNNGVIKLKLTVAHAKCSNCGMERILYFTSNYTYGERIVSTKNGKQCAYVNLLSENIVQELEKYCTELYLENGISMSSDKLARIVSSIYGITCDEIGGEKIDTIPNTKCPNCLERKLVEDDKFGEQLMEIDAFKVTHDSWDKSGDNEKREKVKRELVRQGYLE